MATLKVDTHCPGCDLKCTELNVEGFVHAHFADTAHLKQKTDLTQEHLQRAHFRAFLVPSVPRIAVGSSTWAPRGTTRSGSTSAARWRPT